MSDQKYLTNNGRKIDLRHEHRDHLGNIIVGQGGGHVSSPVPIRHIETHTVPSFVVDIKREILVALTNAMGQPLTRTEIAKAVERKKTRWLIVHIEELVQSGHIEKIPGVWKNGVVMYWYAIPLKGSLQ